MKNTPVISIIVPCYNQAQYLPDTLQSVIDQKFRDWECIVIDDGSQDNTKDIALEWVEKDNRIKYLYKENSGVSDTRNYGIKHALGKYIFPLDGDDKVDERYLLEALDILSNSDNIKLVYSNTIEFGSRNTRNQSPPYSFEKMLTENLIPCSALFRKSDFEKTSGYNKNMQKGLEDWDFWLSFLLPQDAVYKLDGFYLHYRIKDVSRSTLIDKEKNEQLILQIFKNHIPLFLDYFNPIRNYIEADYYKKETNTLSNSIEYKIGYTLCHPFQMLKRLYQRIFK